MHRRFQIGLSFIFLTTLLISGCGKPGIETRTDSETDQQKTVGVENEYEVISDDGTLIRSDDDQSYEAPEGISDINHSDNPTQDISKSDNPDLNNPEYDDENNKDTGYGSWQKAYLNALRGDQVQTFLGDDPNEVTYSFIYVDGDDIPELVLDGGVEYRGSMLLTCHEGSVDILQTYRLYFEYIEKGNLLNNAEGHQGYYIDNVFEIRNGKWENVLDGYYYSESIEELEYDEDTGRFHCQHYEINGEELSEEEYLTRLNAVFDSTKAITPSSWMTSEDLQSYLETNKCFSGDHRYELFIEDCSWYEAAEKCKEKGGYLATLTCDDEFAVVEDMIRKEEHRDICFYIGAGRGDMGGWQWFDPEMLQTDLFFNVTYKHWLKDMPSYTDTLSDGTVVQNDRVELIYRKAEDGFFMNDIPGDVLRWYPTFSGRVGYICEYNQ